LQARRCTARSDLKTSFSRSCLRARGQATLTSSTSEEVPNTKPPVPPRGYEAFDIRKPPTTRLHELQASDLTQTLCFLRPARPSKASNGSGLKQSSPILADRPRPPGSLQTCLLFTMFQNRHQAQTPMQTVIFSLRISLSSPPSSTPHVSCKTQNGGAERDRTADPLLAKQVLSQLSYSPNLWRLSQATNRINVFTSLTTRHHTCGTRSGKSRDSVNTNMVGPGRLELPTPRLSSVCSNQLSYGPDEASHTIHNEAPKPPQTMSRPPNRARGPRRSSGAPSGAKRQSRDSVRTYPNRERET
jgi:hypothetical protein